MIELRWIIRESPIPYMDGACWQERVLQYRKSHDVINFDIGANVFTYSDWQDVPVATDR